MTSGINNGYPPIYTVDYSKLENVSSTGTTPFNPVKKPSKAMSYIKRPIRFIAKRPGFLVAMAMMGLTCLMRFGANAGTSPQRNNPQTAQWAYSQGAQHVRDSIQIVQAKEQHVKDSIRIADLEKQLFKLTSKAGKKLPK